MQREKPSITVAIVLLTLNQRATTLRCLESLAAIRSPDHQVILWDNGSTDGTAEIVSAIYPEVIVHHHPENVGVASGRNMSVALIEQQYTPTFLFFLDNDMTVEPDFLEKLLAPFQNEPHLVQTTGKIRDMYDHSRLYGAGGCRIRFWLGDTMHVGYRELDHGQYDEEKKCIPSGGCMLVRTDIFHELGGFSTNYDPYGPEDLDFGLTVQKAGYYGLYVPDAVVYHETRPGRTFEGGQYTVNFATKRVQHWFTFMGRHASLTQKAGFYLLGIPNLLAGFVVRQALRGELLSSLRSLFIGIMHYLHPTSESK